MYCDEVHKLIDHPKAQVLSFKVKLHLDYLCIFTGPPSTHLVRSIIVKAFEATMDTKEDMTEFF